MTKTYEDSDETLRLLDALPRDPRALDALFERHLPIVRQSIKRRFRSRVQSRFDLSDVVQETHRDARKQFDDFLARRPMPFGLWLLRTAHQRLVDLERKHLQTAKRSVDQEIPLPDASSVDLANIVFTDRGGPISQALVQEQARIVRRCLAQLDDKDREVLVLRVFDDLSNATVAQLLDLKPETTRKRFARALLKLKQLLTDAGLGESQS